MVFHGDGSLLLDHETKTSRAETNASDHVPIRFIKLELVGSGPWSGASVKAGTSPMNYVELVEALIDMDGSAGGTHLIVRPMHGVWGN